MSALSPAQLPGVQLVSHHESEAEAVKKARMYRASMARAGLKGWEARVEQESVMWGPAWTVRIIRIAPPRRGRP